MPVVQLLVIGALEARATQPEYLQVVGKRGAQDMFGDLGAVRHAIGHGLLVPQSCG